MRVISSQVTSDRASMNEWKYELYGRDHPGSNGLQVEKLGEAERSAFIRNMSRALREPENEDELLRKVYTMVGDSGALLFDIEPANAGRFLVDCGKRVDFAPDASVVLAFPLSTGLSELFRCSVDTLARNFNYIWYPSTDDVVIFDFQLRWIIVVFHYGVVRAMRLARQI